MPISAVLSCGVVVIFLDDEVPRFLRTAFLSDPCINVHIELLFNSFIVINIMNRNCFRIVFNRKLGLLQVASELARARRKSIAKNAAFVTLPLEKKTVARLVAIVVGAMVCCGITLPAYADNVGDILGESGSVGDKGKQGNGGNNGGPFWVGSNGEVGENGGRGSDGNSGVRLTSSATYINSGFISGGQGGQGGKGGKGGTGGTTGWSITTGDVLPKGGGGGTGGTGGNGGAGISIESAGATYINTGYTHGGVAGLAGAGGDGGDEQTDRVLNRGNPGMDGQSGLGGYGIYVNASKSNIINSGTISAGVDGDGVVRSESIMYGTGASNARLELQKGSNIQGKVDASSSSGTNTLALGASDASNQGSFAVGQINNTYLGFNAFQKTGAGTWELTGITSMSTPWTIYDGTLRIAADGALGSVGNALTFGSAGVMAGTSLSGGTGQLEVLNSMSMAHAIDLQGDGGIVVGGNTLTSTGAISGSGKLTVTGTDGTLQFSGNVSRRSAGLTLSSGNLRFDSGARFTIDGAYTQDIDNTGLHIMLDDSTDAAIKAHTASLGGSLAVSNYKITAPVTSASQLGNNDRILIATTHGITGNYSATADQAVEGYDFLRQGDSIKGNNYVMGLNLAWNSMSNPDGSFTLDKGDFTVDQVLGKRADGGEDLNKSGEGTLVLSAQNTYAGNTTVNAGTLALRGEGDISESAGLIIHAGATVDVSGVGSKITQVKNLSGEVGSTFTLGGTVLTVETSEDNHFAGQLEGKGGLIKSGDKMLTLSGSNTYTGATVVNSGVLSAAASDIFSASSRLEVATGATFKMNDLAQAIAQIYASTPGGTIDLGSATLTLTGDGASTASYEGAIIGTGNVVKNGNYTQYLSGDQAFSYWGTTTINAGVLALLDISDNSISNPIVLNGGWLDLSDSPAIKDWSDLVVTDTSADGKGGVIGNGDVVYLQDGVFNVSIGAGEGEPDAKNGVYVAKNTEGETILGGADNTYVGNTRINAGILTVSRDELLGNTAIAREVILGGGTLRVDGSYTSQRALQLAADGRIDVTGDNVTQWQGGVSGKSGDTNNHSLIKTGTGTLVLSGINDYTGDTVLAEGNLIIKDKANLNGGNLVFAEGATNAIFDLSGIQDGAVSIGQLSDNGNGSIIGLGSSTLVIQGGGVFNGIMRDEALSGEIGGGLHKSGDNQLRLTDVQEYTGSTTVAAGVLALIGAGSIANSVSLDLSSATAILDISATKEGASISNLSGARGSMVNLGDQMLVIEQTDDSHFAGDIAGGGKMEKTGARSLTLSGQLAYTGDTLLTEGQLILDGSAGGAQLVSNVIGQMGAALFLNNGARLTGFIDPVDVSIDSTSVWNMTSDSEVSNMALAGITNFSALTTPMLSGRTLKADNWVGQGGTVQLYSVLNNDESVTDQIIIDGGVASGDTKLRIINAGGLGAQTTGDGIKVVATINDASTDDGAFALSNKLFAGAYEYKLLRGGSVDAHDWFLVSQDRSETSLYGTLGNQSNRYGEVVVGSLQERMGALDQLIKKNDTYAWGRVFGQAEDRAASTRTMGQQVDIRGAQVGSDLYVQSHGAGRDSVGVYLASGQSTSRVVRNENAGNLAAFAGKNTIKAYSVGAYFTRLDGAGAYLDSVLQASRYNIASQSADELMASTHAVGLLGSFEIGQTVDLGLGRKLEPQAQLVVQHINMRSFGIDDATTVNFDSGVSVTSRAGLRLSKTDLAERDHPAAVWLALDLLNTSGDNAKTSFSAPGAADVDYVDQLTGTRVKLSAGADGEIRKNLNLNLRVSAERSIDTSHQKSFGITLGLKYAF